MKLLSQTSVRDWALKCSAAIRGGKFERTSESFFVDIAAEVEALIRGIELKFPAKVHADIGDAVPSLATNQLIERLRPVLDRAIARLIQRKVEAHPSVGVTLIGDFK